MIPGIRAKLSVIVRSLPGTIAAGLLLATAVPVWASSALNIVDGWAPATPPGARTAAVYFTVANRGNADVIVDARCDVSSTVELHTHTHVDGMMRMERLDAVPVPSAAEVRFEPHGKHLMLIDLKSPLEPGDTVHVTIRFRDAGEIEFTAAVRDIRQ